MHARLAYSYELNAAEGPAFQKSRTEVFARQKIAAAWDREPTIGQSIFSDENVLSFEGSFSSVGSTNVPEPANHHYQGKWANDQDASGGFELRLPSSRRGLIISFQLSHKLKGESRGLSLPMHVKAVDDETYSEALFAFKPMPEPPDTGDRQLDDTIRPAYEYEAKMMSESNALEGAALGGGFYPLQVEKKNGHYLARLNRSYTTQNTTGTATSTIVVKVDLVVWTTNAGSDWEPENLPPAGPAAAK